MTTILIFSHLFCLALGSALTLIGMRALRSVAVVVEAPPSGFDSDPMMDVDDAAAALGDDWRRYARAGDTGPERIALRTVAHGAGGTIATQGIALPNSGYPLTHEEVEALNEDVRRYCRADDLSAEGLKRRHPRPMQHVRWASPNNLPRTDTGD